MPPGRTASLLLCSRSPTTTSQKSRPPSMPHCTSRLICPQAPRCPLPQFHSAQQMTGQVMRMQRDRLLWCPETSLYPVQAPTATRRLCMWAPTTPTRPTSLDCFWCVLRGSAQHVTRNTVITGITQWRVAEHQRLSISSAQRYPVNLASKQEAHRARRQRFHADCLEEPCSHMHAFPHQACGRSAGTGDQAAKRGSALRLGASRPGLSQGMSKGTPGRQRTCVRFLTP